MWLSTCCANQPRAKSLTLWSWRCHVWHRTRAGSHALQSPPYSLGRCARIETGREAHQPLLHVLPKTPSCRSFLLSRWRSWAIKACTSRVLSSTWRTLSCALFLLTWLRLGTADSRASGCSCDHDTRDAAAVPGCSATSRTVSLRALGS